MYICIVNSLKQLNMEKMNSDIVETDYSGMHEAVGMHLLEARENCIAKTVNMVLGTNLRKEEITKQILGQFQLIEYLHLSKTQIIYKGNAIGEVVLMTPPQMGWQFNPYIKSVEYV